MSQSHKSQAAKVSPYICRNCLPKSTSSTWLHVQYVVNSVTSGAPWECPPLGYRLLMLHFLLHSGLTVKQGPAVSQRSSSTSLVSQYSSSLSLTTSLSEVLGSSGLQGSCSRLYSVAQTVKHLSTMWETRVLSLGREDALEKEMAIHSSTIAWKIPWTEEPGRQIHGVAKSRTWLSDFTTLFGKWELTACNAFSRLSDNPPTTSQSSTTAHTKRIMATWYHMPPSGHWLPPSSGASGSSIHWISANHASCIALHPIPGASCLLYLTVLTVRWTQGRQGTSQEARKRLKEPQELQTHLFSPGWRCSHSSSHSIT